MPLKTGDKVSFLDDVGEGEVVGLIDELRALVLVDGFEQVFQIRELIKIEPGEREEFANKISGNLFKSQPIKKPDSHVLKRKALVSKEQRSDEIDLHMEDLSEDYTGLSPGQILQIQLRYFTEKLEEALRMKKKKLIVIHGVGKGTLRLEVRKLLDDYSNITYCDASYDVYGYGATEVIIA